MTTPMVGLISLCCIAVTAAAALPAKAQDGARLSQEASRIQAQGNLDQALTLLTEALNDTRLSNDRRAIILTDRGALLARLNQPKGAIEDFNRAVQLYSEYPAIYNNRGSTLLTLGLAREAIKDFDRAILLAPGYVAAYSNRAGARQLLNQTEAAIADYTRAIELAPTAIAPLAGRARTLLAASRPQAALRDLTHVLHADNRFTLGYRNRAEARLATDRTMEAIEDLSRAIAFEPGNVEIYIERGHAYMLADNFAAAMKDYSRALELDAKHLPALEARALAHVRIDAQNEAEADMQRALDLNPRSAAALAARALLYLRTSQPDLARREIERAVKLTPPRVEALLAKGQIDEATGRRADAIESYRAALAVSPLSREATAALLRLTGGDRGEAAELRGLGVDSWRVVRRGTRLFAASDDYPRISVPLEAIGSALPRLVDFEVKKPPYKDIAILHFVAGQVQGTAGAEDMQYAAVLDLTQSAVIGIIPDRQGQRRAKWNWEESKLVIEAVDGLTDELALRGGRGLPAAMASAAAARRQAGDGTRAYAPPGWLPWGVGPQPQQQRRAGRQQPKTLLDMLFGN